MNPIVNKAKTSEGDKEIEENSERSFEDDNLEVSENAAKTIEKLYVIFSNIRIVDDL